VSPYPMSKTKRLFIWFKR